MKDSASVIRYIRTTLTALMLMAGASTAYAIDTYNASTHVLTAPSVGIGAVTYSNVVLTVGTIVGPPSGSSPNNSQDLYDPSSGQLTVAAVKVGSNTLL